MIQGTEQEYALLLADCLAALSPPLTAITRTAQQERQIVQKTFDAPLPKHMSVIEEETDREGEDEHSSRTVRDIKAQFNSQVAQLMEANRCIEEVVNFYKAEMQEMAKEIVTMTEKSKRSTEDRIDIRNSRKKKADSRAERQEEDEEPRARPAPSPFQENQCQKCSVLTQRVQLLEKEGRNWKSLSVKIDDCKKKINAYEAEVRAKDTELELLRGKLSESQSHQTSEKSEEEKKRLKKDNTTLRGQKVLQANQIAALRRQLAEKTSVSEALESESLRLRLEVDNLNNSLSWHSTNLTEMRVGMTKSRNEEWKEYGGRMEHLERVNLALTQTLAEQQQSLTQFNEKSKKIEDSLGRRTLTKEKKINQLQLILQDKNETIIRLKTGSRGEREKGEKDKGGYHADMVKVLNKRLTQREERVRVLQDALAHVSPASHASQLQ